MDRTDQARRVVLAPPEQVFPAFLEERAVATWLPPDGMSAELEHFNGRPGGGYRMTLHHRQDGAGKTTARTDVVNVGFLEIEANHRIVQVAQFETDDPEFEGTMKMTWTFTPTTEGTEVLVTAEDVPAGISPQEHQAGLSESLENLAAYVEGRA